MSILSPVREQWVCEHEGDGVATRFEDVYVGPHGDIAAVDGDQLRREDSEVVPADWQHAQSDNIAYPKQA